MTDEEGQELERWADAIVGAAQVVATRPDFLLSMKSGLAAWVETRDRAHADEMGHLRRELEAARNAEELLRHDRIRRAIAGAS